MTGDNINAGSPLPQSHLINQQFAAFEDKLTHLLASYQFYDQAIRALTCPNYHDESDTNDWHLGLFLTQQWLAEQGEQLIMELRLIRQSIKRIRLLISSNFSWQTNGPIQCFFRQQVQSQFFNGDFMNDGELRIVNNDNMGIQSRKRLVERLQSIGEYFEGLNQDDRQLDMQDRLGTTMILALLPWAFQAFTNLEKNCHSVAKIIS